MVYNNLSQLLEGRLVYFRSTDIEQKNWHRLLWSIPDEWFYLLSQGEKIIVWDISSNKGKIEHIFIPVLNDLLNQIFLGDVPRAKSLREHFYFASEALNQDRSLKTRILFWKGKILNRVQVEAKTFHVDKELNPLQG